MRKQPYYYHYHYPFLSACQLQVWQTVLQTVLHRRCKAYWLLFFCILAQSALAQQHYARHVSSTVGKIIGQKGSSLSLHYHLNSLDELRMGWYQQRWNNTNSNTNYRNTLFHLDYVMGYKPATTGWQKLGFYYGGGIIFGTIQQKPAFGIHALAEVEVAPLPRWSAFLRWQRAFLLQHQAQAETDNHDLSNTSSNHNPNDKNFQPGIWTIGIRLYW